MKLTETVENIIENLRFNHGGEGGRSHPHPPLNTPLELVECKLSECVWLLCCNDDSGTSLEYEFLGCLNEF